MHILHQALDAGLTHVERDALNGSAVAANALRRRWLNAERLQQRLHQLKTARQDDAQGDTPAEMPAWMAKTPRNSPRTILPGTGASGRLADCPPPIQPIGASGAWQNRGEHRRSRSGSERGQRPCVSSFVHPPNGA